MSEAKHRDHIDEAKVQLQRFVSDPDARILVLRGDYGSGKSYFLREYLKEGLPKGVPKWQSYTSVFSVESVKDLQEIITASIEGSKDNKIARGGQQTPAKLDAGLSVLQKALKPFVGGVNLELSVSSLIWSLAKNAGMLLVVDDIDRKPAGMKIEDLVGFVSSLMEHADGKSKAILVINDKELDPTEKDQWAALREKFLDREITFEPDVAALAHHYVKDEKLKELIAEAYSVINQRNIRSMLRAERLVCEVESIINSRNSALADYERRGLVQLAAIFLHAKVEFSYGELQEACTDHFYSFKGKQISDNVRKVQELVKKFDALYEESLSRIAIELFKTGKVEDCRLDSFIKKRFSVEEQTRREACRNEFWKVYCGDFNSSLEDYEAAASKLLREAPEVLHVHEIIELVHHFDELGLNSDDLVRSWAASPEHQSVLGSLAQVRELLPADVLERVLLPTSQEEDGSFTVRIMRIFRALLMERDYPSADYIQSLADKPLSEFVDFLVAHKSEHLLSDLRKLYEADFSGSRTSEALESMKSKLADALSELAKTSTYRRWQIKHMLGRHVPHNF